ALWSRIFKDADQYPATMNQRLHRAQVVDERRLRERILEAKLAKPLLVRLRPRLAREAHPSAQQELRQAVTRAHQVLARVLHAAGDQAPPRTRARRDRAHRAAALRAARR